jgi:electron transfer flavoprotein alpha/beta subunit
MKTFARTAEDYMKALVAVKRVVDANVKVRVKPDNSGPLQNGFVLELL